MPGRLRKLLQVGPLAIVGAWPVATDRPIGSSVARFGSSFETIVPAENPAHIPIAVRELEALRQSLRILDSQYVERQRVKPRELLLAGLTALRSAHPGLIEFRSIFPSDIVANRAGRSPQARLCISGEDASRFSLCPASSSGRLSLAAKALAPLTATETDNSASGGFQSPQPLLIRVGARIFLESVAHETSGMIGLDPVARAVITEVSRQSRSEMSNEIHRFLNGALTQLDPHSAFLNASEYRELHIGTRGQFGGVGIVVNTLGSVPVVDEVVKRSPAERAGVKSGDVILRVGNSGTLFQSVSHIVDELRAQTTRRSAQVWFYRPSTKSIFETSLRREEIQTKTVELRRNRNFPDILFARITSFSEQTAEELWSEFEKGNGATGYRGVVLDLRGNPGGLLDEAVQMSDLFLDHGKIVSVKSRFDEQDEQATRGSKKISLPLVVLVNASSASASEILAGALRDQNRALILGERTFGKGSVQSLFETGEGTALKLTVAHHFTPSGQSIQGTGILPHIGLRQVEWRGDVLWATGPSEESREAELPFHLDNPEVGPAISSEALPYPVVWHLQRSRAPSVTLSLEEIDRFPNHLNLSGGTLDLETDGAARVALQAVHRMVRENISTFSPFQLQGMTRALQHTEVAALPPSSRALFGSPTTGPALVAGDLSPLICCNREPRRLRILGDDNLKEGLIGLKMSGHAEGPVAWIPLRRLEAQPGGGTAGTFQIPDGVIAFLTGTEPRIGRIPVVFRRGLLDAETAVGELIADQATPSLQIPEISTTPWTRCDDGRAHCTRVSVRVREPSITPLTLDLVTLAAGDHHIDQSSRSFQTTFSGVQEAAFTIIHPGERPPSDFGGVVGAMVRNGKGEIVGRWPLVSLEAGGAIRLGAVTPEKVTQR